MNIEIRPVQTHEEYHAVEQVQREAWGVDHSIVVPLNVMLTAHKNGGLVLGAFDSTRGVDSEHLVGFVFGFVGLLSDGTVKHCSHMAGVLPGYQGQRIGYRLKCMQRDHVLAQGISLITWTFDPLVCRNGFFNLRKLGATCTTYLRNVYGTDPFDPQVALPSDRFQVDWHIASDHVQDRLSRNTPPPSLASLRASGTPLLDPLADSLSTIFSTEQPSHCLVQVPTNIQDIKAADPHLAVSWRQHTRDLFERAFASGYTATDMLIEGETGCYVLTRMS